MQAVPGGVAAPSETEIRVRITDLSNLDLPILHDVALDLRGRLALLDVGGAVRRAESLIRRDEWRDRQRRNETRVGREVRVQRDGGIAVLHDHGGSLDFEAAVPERAGVEEQGLIAARARERALQQEVRNVLLVG